MRNVHVIMPIGVHDTQQPSGGNAYDRRICFGLTRLGWSIWERMVPGAWPEPKAAALTSLAEVLATVPDGTLVLVDGLIASSAPQVLVPETERLRVVILVHMPLGGQPGEEGEKARPHEKEVLTAASAVITTSAWTRDWLVSEYGLRARLVFVAEPGVDVGQSAAGTDDGGTLLCVAAVTPRKGHSDLISALSLIPDLPWRLSIVGSIDRCPAHVEMLRRQITAADLDDRVTFHGPRAGFALSQLYRQSDLLVHASHAETYGMVVTEALAHELPVLATDVGGIPDALGRAPDGARPGLLVPPQDPEALAQALRTWLTEPTVRRELRLAAGRRRTTLTGWADTSRRLARVLEKAAA
ncbi:MAG: glycosyltransferase family 4 protein [Actinomycetes bacterium]